MYFTPNIPRPRRANIRTRVYQGFAGVDISSDPTQVELNRSPYAINMYKNYSAQLGECVETRPGFRRIAQFDAKVNADIFFSRREDSKLVTRRVIHAGENLYRLDADGSKTLLRQGLASARSRHFIAGSKLYIQDGRNYLVYDGTGVEDVSHSAYIPTTTVGRAPDGGGSVLNPVNTLQPGRRNSFLGDGAKKDYSLDTVGLDQTAVSASIDGAAKSEGTDFTVDRAAGIVKWNTAPPAPGTIGKDNVEITFYKTNENYRDRICQSTLLCAFDSRVFFAGNPAFPNALFHSMLDDPSYVPDTAYYKDGPDDAAITALLRVGETLAVIKQDNDQGSTLYYHSPRLDDKAGKIYPMAEGLASIGCIAPFAAFNYRDDPVFLSRHGVEAIGKLDVTMERVLAHRSSTIDGGLVNEPALADAFMLPWMGYLLLLVGGRIYLADERQKYAQRATGNIEYEWYIWDSIGVYEGGAFYPATVLSEKDGELYFGTASGAICKFNTDLKAVGSEQGELAKAAYNDDGRAIYSCWTTPHDNFAVPNHYKTTNKRGGTASMKSFTSSGVKLMVKTDKSFGRFIAAHNAGVFDFNSLDFDDMTFNTLPYNGMVFRMREKKWLWISLRFYSDEIGKPFGLLMTTLEAFVGGYAK